jgi:hypothetical protein
MSSYIARQSGSLVSDMSKPGTHNTPGNGVPQMALFYMHSTFSALINIVTKIDVSDPYLPA